VNIMRFKDVLDSTGAMLVRGDAERLVHGVSTDTRTLQPRALYLALSGPNFDGNAFARQAGERGAGGLLLRAGRDLPLSELPVDAPVAVHDAPLRALSDLASWHRARLSIPVVGITGSCGKTSTKNILRQLLQPHLSVVSSPASFNNDVGVPHTLLLADPDTQALVVEIGTNAPGEIAALCRVARPTVGIVTNIGASHLEKLGSIEGVAREKSALFESLPPDGLAVLNLDCRYAAQLRSATRARVVTISVEGEGDFDARDLWFHSGGTTFRLQGHEITSPLIGSHNVYNLLAALAAATGLGLPLEALLPAVAQLEAGRRRMERRRFGALTVFDDSYNANPESARAAVRVLEGLHGSGRRVMVLGDMLELGEGAPELHHQIGCAAARANIDLLLLVGEITRAAAAGALECGLPPERVLHLGGTEQALQRIADLVRAGDIVLVKGSRRMGLDRLVDRLGERFGEAPETR
jgi:UDP-N-acetylmuramoyl-tripeptide--D-alanyl-D-alanine ligase